MTPVPFTKRPRVLPGRNAASTHLVLLAAALLAACVYESETIECPSGVRCPADTMCVPEHPACGPREHVTACIGRAEDTFCEVEGLPGQCKQGICDLGPCERSDDCNDNNPCTDDTCNQGRCDHEANTAPCDDHDFCNGPDQCENKVCTSTGVTPCAAPTHCDVTLQTCVGCMSGEHCPPPTFSDWSDCEAGSDVCSLSGTWSREVIDWSCEDQVCLKQPSRVETGTCRPPDLPDPSGAACNDGNACTEQDQCGSGQCQGQPRACADDNPCTREGCDPANGCTQADEPRTILCPGGHCNGKGTCLDCPNAGQFCSEGLAPCQRGILRCSESGNHVCELGGTLPDGTSCGPGLTCSAGQCR